MRLPFRIAAWVLAFAATAGAAGMHRHERDGDGEGPHGGYLLKAGDGWFELLGESRGLRVYLLDEEKKVLPVFRAKGSFTAEVDKGTGPAVELVPAGGYLVAKARIDFGKAVAGEVSVESAGVTRTARLKASLPSTDYDASVNPTPAPPTPTPPPGH